ncbi:MAG: hypothetical protein NZ524_02765 [Thiobacillaceae bacterium]|nr:hypothetical protein [Thiobacillaceae bacterium]MDW8324172.1 hypothetical protein [Burkholderiales bacterium]
MDKITMLAGPMYRVVDTAAAMVHGAHERSPGHPSSHSEGMAQVGLRLSTFGVLWQRKDQLLAQVQAAAQQRNAAERVDELVHRMQREIAAMVKNYPPFPIGSEERQHYLRSISALRHQIEALIVPPEHDSGLRLPEPPDPPPEAALDAEWQGYGERLDAYRVLLRQQHTALSEQIEGAKMWPEVGQFDPQAAEVSALMRDTAARLRQSAHPLSAGSDAARARLDPYAA